MKTLKTLVIASTLLASTSVLAHTFNEADKAIKYRQAAFTMIAGNVSEMGEMVKGKTEWSDAIFAKRANQLSELSLMPLDAFYVEGSDKGKTNALPKVWTNFPDFEARLAQFQEDTASLASIADKGDKAAIRKAFGKAVKNCKACHSDYKAK
ncbi:MULTISPECIES: c-type cytochrome [Aliivibrio]|uniref:Cytochrome c n=1 Tax=Aliivibrio finisterrensis TaxID=511998 RepID=A0A4Q5KTE3_9GAMM|nr:MULTISPECIES: cytochrome c [Aliivibrio]MDD9180212.1 cytochrome c [Aliivibrio sp. A6]RYU49358.1 cytochrome c [Aliivibrio finisterrensis]RYU49828.1 cytochrome c [Aliivibrio finisterrensis]RYU55492.1 cytochrome c [Aliivibrio finisterrensis]RYU61858.1 cytochrome c [Aliivibrio finisterrensis]